MDPRLIDRLHTDLDAADYRVEAVRALLGAEADDARLRGVFVPARRVLDARGPSALATLIRVFLLGDAVDPAELDAALPALGASGAGGLGLAASGQQPILLRAALALNPVRIDEDPRLAEPVDWWIISDLDDQLRRGPARSDHVMGVGGATRSLIAQLPPGEEAPSPDLEGGDVQRSLDLGTGCGIVALHLGLRGPVLATDISARALTLAEANARVNGMAHRIEFRQGDLFAPAVDERFALIASNPPFVVTPRGDDEQPRYEYRDGGLVGDALAERVVREAPRHLADGGTLLCLANWESHWGGDGLGRVRDWIAGAAAELPDAGLAGWVIERDRVSPERYAETWARDGGARVGEPAFDALVQAWLADFAERRVTALGLGSIRIRRLPGAQPASGVLALRTEQATGAYSAAAGTHLDAAFAAAIATARLSDAEVLAARWMLDDAVVEHREHRPGQEAPRAIALSTDAGIARRVSADPLLAAAVGACDGELDLGQIADALASLLQLDADDVADALVSGARELVWLGMLAPQGPAGDVE